MNLLERLFNAPPTRDARTISDKQGRRYWMVWDDDEEAPVSYLWYHGKIIGQAKLLWTNPVMQLADIRLFKPEYMRKGIGSALLQEVISYARTRRAQSISGWIARRDAEVNPDLFRWYRRHGFHVTFEKHDISVANIYLELNPIPNA
ncbi:MAG: GNAT family N-acetyltransferase [Chloroflexi bacterium]|nr:GNAT family N-acetyltransferase [Chloroflexota bacterium]